MIRAKKKKTQESVGGVVTNPMTMQEAREEYIKKIRYLEGKAKLTEWQLRMLAEYEKDSFEKAKEYMDDCLGKED